MKQDFPENQSTLISQQKFSFTQQTKIKTKCPKENLGYFVCMNKRCQAECAIICKDENCQCSTQHQKCVKVQIQNLTHAIKKQAYSFSKIEQKIKNSFKKTIDDLSQMEQKIILEFSQLFATQAYSSLERQYLSSLNSQSIANIKSTMVYQIYAKIYQRQVLQKNLHQLSQKLQKLSNNLIEETNIFDQKLKQNLLHLQNIYMDKEKQIAYGLFQNSKIILKLEDQKSLLNFFPLFPINTQLLYRASEHDFSKNKFHELCEDIENILILIRTENNKLIGGYTPLCFPSKLRSKWRKDLKSQSFLFSLTQKDKFLLIKPELAIGNFALNHQYIFQFGQDLCIADKANIKDSIANFHCSYKNQKYQNNYQGYNKFTGSNYKQFKIKEWQVWKLSFAKSQN